MANRNGGGSTFWPTLRSVFTSGTLGQFNASQEKRRVVPKRSYVFGIVVAFQPELAKALLDDAASGTPQRLLVDAHRHRAPRHCAHLAGTARLPRLDPPLLARHEVIDGTVRHRLTLPTAVAAEVWANDRQRQLEGCAPLDEHLDLIRLKVAGILALWDGRLDINDEDWSLAGQVVNCWCDPPAGPRGHRQRRDPRARSQAGLPRRARGQSRRRHRATADRGRRTVDRPQGAGRAGPLDAARVEERSPERPTELLRRRSRRRQGRGLGRRGQRVQSHERRPAAASPRTEEGADMTRPSVGAWESSYACLASPTAKVHERKYLLTRYTKTPSPTRSRGEAWETSYPSHASARPGRRPLRPPCPDRVRIASRAARTLPPATPVTHCDGLGHSLPTRPRSSWPTTEGRGRVTSRYRLTSRTWPLSRFSPR